MTSTRGGTGEVIVSISIDTEEDDWASYAAQGASVRNIQRLPELQECFQRWGARPSYLVNRPPLLDADSVEVLGELARTEGVEIGAHCHPWNTPPFADDGAHRSMMCAFSDAANRAKLAEIRRCHHSELGNEPTTFKAGRWGMGPSVARPLAALGFEVDCSVTPLIDWTPETGPDYLDAPHQPYRFRPDAPLLRDLLGTMVEMPSTVGYLSGDPRRREGVRRWIEGSPLRRAKVLGIADRTGLLARRWLSPETSSGDTMARLADACVSRGASFLQLTFHSCALLPGSTPFVRDEHDRRKFLGAVDRLLSHCSNSGFTFKTLRESGREIHRWHA